MQNILLDELPSEFDGYPINTSFRIGVQISLIYDDAGITEHEKSLLVRELLFGDENGTVASDVDGLTVKKCVEWFMNGWFHDKNPGNGDKTKLMDYDIDQFRIYADFIAVYGIDLSTAELHWWAFQGLLWNMPHERSAFLQAIEIRTKKPRKGASPEEVKAINKAHAIYDLDQPQAQLSREEEKKIDAYDKMVGHRR